MSDLEYYCIDCGRKIKHRGRCLPCNVEAKRKLEAQDRRKSQKGW